MLRQQQAAQMAQKAKELPLGSDKQIEEAYRIECGGDPAKARFNSYFEMKKFILDQRYLVSLRPEWKIVAKKINKPVFQFEEARF